MITEDKVLRCVISYVKCGGARGPPVEPATLQPCWKRKDEISMELNLLYSDSGSLYQ